MSKAQPAKGTRDFAAEEVRKRQFIFNTIIGVYEEFGFEPLETPAMENIETLTGKYGEEGDQLLFRILRSGNFLTKVAEDELTTEALNKLRAKIVDKGLRYDLTIPFARFVAKNHQAIGLPYKRYQIQPVWRADRPAKGRYREFYQCDADVAGAKSALSDSEFVLMIDQVFSRLNMPRVTTHLNNRKVLFGIAENHGLEDRFIDMTVAFDKLDKIGVDGVAKELANRGFTDSEVLALTPYLNLNGSNEELIAEMRSKFTNTETGIVGLTELEEVIEYVSANNIIHSDVKVNFALARGLNYYTGTIYEVTLNGVDMGSVASGGRYDDLTSMFGLNDVPGVGLSFGAERIYDVMEQLNLFPKDQTGGLEVYFTNMDAKNALVSFKAMNQMRNAGIKCDMFPTPSKLGKQFKLADKKQAKYVVVIGDDEAAKNLLALKDLATGTQHLLSVEEAISHIKNGQ